jgi:dolichyl-diphosphooligosaccharide--protein glycosyltransferase
MADVPEGLTEYGPYLGIFLLVGFMFWVRIRPSDRVITESAVFFSGNDPWYHARIVNYVVRYFPATPNFDPYSYFPYGTARHSGFGGLFDQLIALAALVVGGGSPSNHLIEVVTAYAPPVFGALTVVPVYFLAKRLSGRWPALLTAGLLAVVNGQFLTRTIIGVADHQSAESFFGAVALLGFAYAFERAYLEQPTLADVKDQNWRVLKSPISAGILGGIAISSYLLMWPPGVFLIFPMGVFVIIQLTREHLRGRSTEYLTFSTVVSMVTAGILTLLYVKSYEFNATSFSLLQPVVLFGIAAGSLVLWWLAEWFQKSEYDPNYYPLAVGGIIAGTVIASGFILPRVFSLIEALIIRIYSFGLLTSPTAGTVAEIAPATPSDAWQAYALLFPIAIAGFLMLAYRVIQENRPFELLILLWSLTVTSAYFTMIRFGYYFAIFVALLAGFAIIRTAKFANLDDVRALSDLEGYQILVILIIVVGVFPGNVIAVGGTSSTAWDTADRLGGTNTAWQNELAWMNQNTPDVPLADYGQYEEPDSGDFEYRAGAYGVMSWWDYGHWITYTAERIPNANPFQQGPRTSSAFLLSENETRANLILEALPSQDAREDIPSMSVQELRQVVDSQSSRQASEDTRYVVIDDQMAAGKFSAIATWTGPGPGAYFSRQEFEVGGGTARLLGTNDRYRSTMLARLYYDDAQGLSHYRLVHESESTSAIVSVAQETQSGYEPSRVINQRLSRSIFQAVRQRPDLAFYNVREESSVKVYERVPGATISGQVDTENATTVFAVLRLQTNVGRNFTYVQSVETDDQGNFELTVPYATTNTVGPSDGGTDSGVTANGKYELFTGNPFQPSARGNTSVPEPAVYDGETIEVELTPVEQPGDNETTEENTTGSSNESALTNPGEPTAPVSAALGSGSPSHSAAAPLHARDG